MRATCARPPRAHVEILPNIWCFQTVQHRISMKHMKTYDFLIQRNPEQTARALLSNLQNQIVVFFFQRSCQMGLHGALSRARRTNSTTSARLPEAPSLSNNTMRATCARPRASSSYTKLASRKCYHNKSLYPCASVVAKVVRMPRSEVSERHRAGSWVWVVAKSRLEIW